MELDEATNALEAAQRLSEQLDRKEAMMGALKEEGSAFSHLCYLLSPLSSPKPCRLKRIDLCNILKAGQHQNWLHFDKRKMFTFS